MVANQTFKWIMTTIITGDTIAVDQHVSLAKAISKTLLDKHLSNIYGIDLTIKEIKD